MKANRFGTSATFGFTLVELMVTIAIMIIIVAALLKLVSGVSEKAKVTKTQSEIKLLSDAVEAFKQSTGYYPLSVPYDAWTGNWYSFVQTVDWDGKADGNSNNITIADWKDYFYEDPGSGPEYQWTSPHSVKPTNIHMLTFQLTQVPASNSIVEKLKQNYKVTKQESFNRNGGEEHWLKEENPCQLKHPLDGNLRIVYQPQDGWGTPLRYWSGKIMDWAKAQSWDGNGPSSGVPIQTFISDKLQENNWGFFIESAGPDEYFGWWGDSSASYTERQTEDNIY